MIAPDTFDFLSTLGSFFGYYGGLFVGILRNSFNDSWGALFLFEKTNIECVNFFTGDIFHWYGMQQYFSNWLTSSPIFNVFRVIYQVTLGGLFRIVRELTAIQIPYYNFMDGSTQHFILCNLPFYAVFPLVLTIFSFALGVVRTVYKALF